MRTVFLIHDGKIQHYRVPVYRYLSEYLEKQEYNLYVVSSGLQEGRAGELGFRLIKTKTNFISLLRLILKYRPWACILFINHSRRYYFALLVILRLIRKRPITWTHGVDLQRKGSLTSRLVHHLEHALCSGIILYSEWLKSFLATPHKKKAFVANNTLYFGGYRPLNDARASILAKHGIGTTKNIIFIGRLSQRKRIEDLLAAFNLIKDTGCGLVLAGPDVDMILSRMKDKDSHIYITGPIYGTEALDLLSSCDLFCMPAAIGLSIVDAMYCGLPVVTEAVDHGPEIMYFRDGINGFMVKAGDIKSLAEKLRLLIENDELRQRMSENARREIETNGHIDNLCRGFVQCLDFVAGGTDHEQTR
jgi:glycosyltransferase involved in cell wall biosynthesis